MTLSYIPSDTNDEGIFKATASGILPNGKPVVVNADGTVSVASGNDQGLGTGVVYESASTNMISIVYDTANNKIVVAYRDGGDSNYGKAVVGTVSGNSISFGSPVTFYNAAATNMINTVFDTNSGKIVFVFKGSSNYGIAIVGTVSGTSISFGSTTNFLASTISADRIGLAYDSTNNKVVVGYRSNFLGKARVGTISGTNISFGTEVTFNGNASIGDPEIVYEPNAQKFVFVYSNTGNGSRGTAIVGTVSGTDISFGTAVVFNGANTNSFGISYDANAQKVLIAYMDEGNSYYGTAIVATVSGTDISFGSEAVFAAVSSGLNQIVYDSSAKKHVIIYRYQVFQNYEGFIIPATISGTSVSFGTAASFSLGSFTSGGLAYDPDEEKVVLAYTENDNSSYGTAKVFTVASTNLTAENYIGISTGGTYASGSNATVKIIGNTSNEQTSLTAGQAYYVQTDGTIGTTAADPSVFAGTAISATKLIVKT